MKFLIDTNVLIALEPTAVSEKEKTTPIASRFVGLAMGSRHQLYLHPVARADLNQDRDRPRRELRYDLLHKYTELPNPPAVSARLISQLGKARPGTNDWVDLHLVEALAANAADFLVTEDRKLRMKGVRVGLGDRVLTIAEAITLVWDLSERVPSPPPAVRDLKAHAIDQSDPILNSFRADYPNFDEWLQRCCREHRQAWVIDGEGAQLAGFCIVNPEPNPPDPLEGSVLKLCSFKVAAHSNGYRFGELLLKTVFDYAVTNRYDWVFATVFEKYTSIIELFEQFGFSHLPQRTHLGELVLAKPLTPEAEPRRQLTPLAYHVRYGPHYFWPSGVPWYVLPIQPRFASTLFPESASQATLFPGRHPSGNALRKAYLCHSPTRSIQPGAVLAFYRSRSERGIVVIGVVENTLVSTSSIEIARTVGKRTVYSLREIERLCRQPVLVILFRQSRVLRPGISFKELIEAKVLSRGPQSITMLDLEAVEWLQQRIAE